MATLSVNELVDRISELHGTPVEVIGLLSFEFEDQSLWHFPKAERRPAPESGPAFYSSSVWIAFGGGSIQPNKTALTRWNGKHVYVSGIVYGASDRFGCGHMGGWPCEIVPYSIERR